MAIDTSGKWWVGGDPKDIREYLDALTEESYPINEFRLVQCSCGGFVFQLEADANEGAARRKCASCGNVQFICDADEYWDESDPEQWQCIECGSAQANIGVGFSLYDDGKDIHWLYLGIRCTRCGVLGCAADWKIGYSPSLQLMDRV